MFVVLCLSFFLLRARLTFLKSTSSGFTLHSGRLRHLSGRVPIVATDRGSGSMGFVWFDLNGSSASCFCCLAIQSNKVLRFWPVDSALCKLAKNLSVYASSPSNSRLISLTLRQRLNDSILMLLWSVMHVSIRSFFFIKLSLQLFMSLTSLQSLPAKTTFTRLGREIRLLTNQRPSSPKKYAGQEPYFLTHPRVSVLLSWNYGE